MLGSHPCAAGGGEGWGGVFFAAPRNLNTTLPHIASGPHRPHDLHRAADGPFHQHNRNPGGADKASPFACSSIR